MASTSRAQYASPPLSPPRRTQGVNYPTTPDSNFRNRRQANGQEGTPGSPSSDTASSTNTQNGPGPLFRTSTSATLLMEPSFSSGQLGFSTANSTRKVIIRSDQTLATCFDPADQELYRLWAPRR
ncbi:hypothetical protein EIP91_006680 [Steccherinum ochraceum]|uniref:Uncharacterized protein n=1 Tax=Steccherinum ochraceum TaxID=92696 RepID=A0A4R0RR22_9APHY|nr:hypothetical protein EIP91_006680 [Steccherinum ochraceum]